MFKRMKLGAKIGTGFGFLIVISLIVGAVSVFNMHYVRDGVDKLSREYTPEAILASELERRVYRTMYNIRGYGFTGDKKFYEEGMTAMAQVKETIAKLEDLASRSVHSVRLKESLEEIKKKLSEYEGLVERTKKLITQQQEAATRMRSTAGVYMENVYRVLNDQNSSMERELTKEPPRKP
jgi:methyl-accepting chemotaxis protein